MISKTWVAGGQGASFFRVLVFLVIFAGVVTAAWIFCLPPMVTSALQKKTGFNVKVTGLVMNPFAVHVDVKDLNVTASGAPFERLEFLDIRRFDAQGSFFSLMGERPVVQRAALDIAQLTFVRTRGGALNAGLFESRLNPVKENEWPIETPSNPLPKEKTGKKKAEAEVAIEKPRPFLIRSLEIKIDKIVVVDYSQGETGAPAVKEYPVALAQTFENVSDTKPLPTLFAVHGGLTSVGSALKALVPGPLGVAIHSATRARFQPAPAAPGQPPRDTLKTLSDALEESRKP